MLKVTVTLALAAPTAVRAQHGPEKCGTAPYVEDDIETFKDWLTGPEQADWRGEQGFQALDASVPIAQVDDERVCGDLLREVLAQLQSLDQIKSFQPNGFQHRIYEVGPYFAAVFSQSPPKRLDKDASLELPPDLILFFDESTLTYLREVLR